MILEFHGGAREVGGSCITLDSDNNRIALDYGVKIEEGMRSLPMDLDLAVVSHAHLDHTGNLLALSDTKIPIMGSRPTQDCSEILLKDMVKIQKMNCDDFPYNFSDVDDLMVNWLPREAVALPGMEIRLYDAGHVLGGRMIHVRSNGKTLLYTGDFCVHNTEILQGADTSLLPKCPDVLVMESTYGGTVRPKREELVRQLLREIVEAINRGGNILIPTFAFHRSQEMAKRIDMAFESGALPQYRAYCISGMAYELNNYFNDYKSMLYNGLRNEESPFHYRNVRHVRRSSEVKNPAIVICTPGFGQAGASLRLLKEWCDDANNSVIINSGYLPPTSPLAAAKEGRVPMEDGTNMLVNAEVEHIKLSGHADQPELVDFVKKIKPKMVLLVHGDVEQSTTLSKALDGVADVYVPEKGESFSV